MAITTTNTLLRSTADGKKLLFRIVVSGTDTAGSTSLLIFDNSAYFNDPTAGRIQRLYPIFGQISYADFYFDATTPHPVLNMFPFTAGPTYQVMVDFSGFGGYPNPGDAGSTGDILLVVDNESMVGDLGFMLELSRN